MKQLLSIAAVLALAAARPETYKETEDFNYQRSSTDEGSKSGFYNAQRGNVGGNYERARNMDGLAQHQMSTAVKQVEGELGEASTLKSGQVFTSAQSGGMFGSGHYDLSNLQGRNFHDNSYGTASQSHSALSSHQSAFNDRLSSSMHNSAHNSLARNSGSGYGYQGTKTGQLMDSSNLQAVDDVRGVNYGYGTNGAATSHSSGGSSQSGYHSQNLYENSNANQYSTHGAYGAVPQNRLIYTAPVRVYGRPGSRVAVPIGVQTYDATHSASTLGHRASALDHSASTFDHSAAAVDRSASTFDHSAATLGHSASALDHSASTFDQSASTLDHNAINTEAEVLNTGDQHVVGFKPTSNAKHYESSYNYRKQWEKHDVQPEVIALAIPTESPFPKNSELYEDAQLSNNQYHASGLNSHSGYSNIMQNAHNSNVKSLSASQLHQAAIDSQHAASLSNINAQMHGAYNSANSADTANVLGGIDTKPKSYQSAYSYHKSWERQGDPYVIKPVSGSYSNLDSQSLTDASNHQGYSHQSGLNYRKTHQGYTHSNGIEDCDENGSRRVARSVRNLQGNDDLTQQSQNSWSNVEDLGQQAQNSWDSSDALRQAHYHQNAQVQQQAQQNQWDNVEELGQQTQNSWDRSDALREAHNYQNGEVQQQVQQKQWGNLEDLGQQTQNSWDRSDALRQAHNHQNAQGQQQVQQNQWDNLEETGQQTQNTWDKSDALRQAHDHQNAQTQQNQLGKLEDLGQVQQNSWDLEDLTQQTQQHKWDSQRHSGQVILNAWPGYVSEPDKSESEYDNEHQDQEMTQDGSSQSKSNPWDNLGQEQIQQGQRHFKYSGEERKEISQVGSSDFNQKQQSQSSPWDDLSQQQIQQAQTYFKNAGEKETGQQQANINWTASEYLDRHKYKSQHQQEEEQPPQTPVWPSNGNEGNLYHRPSSYHHNQEINHHSDTGSFDLYDWSQASADKANTDFSQLGSLWDKISEVDGQFSASHFQMGREYQNNNLSVNQNTIILNSTVKPEISDIHTIEQHSPTPESPKIIQNSRQDIGRGDIGPEEDFIEQNPPITHNESRPIIDLTKEIKNMTYTINDHVKEVNNNEKTLNKWFEEEKRNQQLHNLNPTQHSSWRQGYYYSGNTFKNQTTLNTNHQNEFKYNKSENEESHIYNKKYTSNVQQTPEFPTGNQELVPLNQCANSSLNVDMSQKSSEKIMPQNSVKFSELEPVEIQQQQQNMFRVDAVEFEHINQNLDQQTQKFNDNESFWGQSLESPLQVRQMQQQAETFGVRIKDNKLKSSKEITLAENLKRESGELSDMYRSNHNLPHINETQYNQMQTYLQSREFNNTMQQTTQDLNVTEGPIQNLSIPVVLTTEKPGLFKRFKNKFLSLFSKSDNSDTTGKSYTESLSQNKSSN